ncbi:MAG: aromatic amino acid transporter [Candidatus Malihini olakiniferum]
MSADVFPFSRSHTALGGAMIIAGTALGAGMFSIPIVTAGVWFSGSVLLLIATWFCMYASGLMILETNLHYPAGTSFHTMVKDLLGKQWNALNSLSVVFVLYILTYAYISAGGLIITHTLAEISPIGQATSGFLFSLLVAFIVWLSARAVDRLITILIGGMVITFVLAVSDLFTQVNHSRLLMSAPVDAPYFPYALAALPYLLASFGYHGNVLGLVKYYHKDGHTVARSLLYGTLLSLAIYLLWQYVIQGNIPREGFKEIVAEGGNIGNLLQHMGSSTQSAYLMPLLNAFSYMALVSSFLGVSLGLFDYIHDSFSLADTPRGRTQAACITFIPPTLAALIDPDGFLHAIGFAGLAATLWAVIIPACMVVSARKRFSSQESYTYRAPGEKLLVFIVLAFGAINMMAHLLTLLGALPVYA